MGDFVSLNEARVIFFRLRLGLRGDFVADDGTVVALNGVGGRVSGMPWRVGVDIVNELYCVGIASARQLRDGWRDNTGDQWSRQ
eukprot:scaffold15298_cov49-Attheya_sp.AAC.1